MDAQFVAACSTIAQLPPPSLPEAAVVGRSNCGKSSLINALAGREGLARTSATPGRTRQILFFRITQRSGSAFHLVDLPGYGYAKAAKPAQREWGELVTHFIDNRRPLRVLLLLIDSRRDPGPEEHDLLRWATERSLQPLLVLTKSDKLNKSRRHLAIDAAARALGVRERPLAVSVHDPPSVVMVRRRLLSLLGSES